MHHINDTLCYNLSRLSEAELTWLAGLLEGEACFHSNRQASSTSIVIILKMTDRDVVERAAALMNTNVFIRPDYRPHCKTSYVARIYGQKAYMLMQQLLPYMGQRRKARIQECLKLWESRSIHWNRGYDGYGCLSLW